MTKQFRTTHDLPFKAARWRGGEILAMLLDDDPYYGFQVGTMHGAWRATDEAYEILSFLNADPGNGHLIDTLEWFEHSARRDNRALRILAVENKRFKQHLIDKWGFEPDGEINLIKRFV